MEHTRMKFRTRGGLTTLKKLLKKRYGTDWNKGRIIHESTGPYSNYLREFAA
ncbi:hypothetical protein [Candidatus Cryosericum hinesii]|jgi:hypothetical protein|uniref:hypothetical protein n=1 Tax=Candidatus Cryosericum hinesii TaxID=2290915 RepID=UPI001402B0D9|nr:hypothetical protein [Candidatus Cryosericum hinesii]